MSHANAKTVAVVCLLLFPIYISPQCSSNDTLANNYVANAIAAGILPTDSSGNYIVTYGYTDTDGNATSQAPPQYIADAFSAWSAQSVSGTTGVVFQQAAQGDSPDLTLAQTQTMPDGSPNDCIENDSGKNAGIYYNSTFANRTDTSMKKIATEHEIGHILGLDDQSPNTNPPGIMNTATPHNCATATSTATGITNTDAASAAGCQKKAKAVCKKCLAKKAAKN